MRANSHRFIQTLQLAAAVGLLAGATSTVFAADGMALAKKHNCLACHSVDKKVVGPAYKDVAAKYKGDASAIDKLTAKVKNGGKGVWGGTPMPPNKKVPDADIKALVTWVLSL